MRTHLPRRVGAASLAALLLAGCESITEPEEQRLVDVQLDFCASNTPVWFAYRNQDADWVRVTPDAGGTVSFTATNRVILAFARLSGTAARTEIVYAHNLELEQVSGQECLEDAGAKQVFGSVAGISTGQLAQVSMVFATRFLESTQTLWSVQQLPDRLMDLVASRMNVDGASYAANRVIIRRSFNPVHNETLPVLDFSVVGTESFAPTTAVIEVSGTSGALSGYMISNFTSQLGTSHELAFLDGPPVGSIPVTAIPTAQLAAGDQHVVIAAVFDEDGSHGAQRFFRVPATHPLPIAGPAERPTISTIGSTPYPRLRASATRMPAYGGAFSIEYRQPQGLGVVDTMVVTMTRLYSGGGEWRADIPDLSSVNGWQNSFGFQAGGSPISWTSFVFGGRAELILGAKAEEGEGLPFATHASSTSSGAVAERVSASRPRPPLFGRPR